MAEWLSYSTTIDGKPAFVDFDASLDDDAYRTDHPQTCELVVSGFPIDAARLPTDAADDSLYALEQRLEAILSGRDGELAVMSACDGSYRFIAYSVDGTAGSEFAAAASEAGLTAQVSTRSDPQWQSYERWALTGEELEVARDRTQLEELGANGVDLSEEHEFYFDFEFEDGKSADQADDALSKGDFTVTERDLDDAGDDDHIVQVALTIVPSTDAIGNARRKMTALVAPYDGRYLGWGCDPDE